MSTSNSIKCGKRIRTTSSHSNNQMSEFSSASATVHISHPSSFLADQTETDVTNGKNSTLQPRVSNKLLMTGTSFDLSNNLKNSSDYEARKNSSVILPSSPPSMPRLRDTSRVNLRPKTQLRNNKKALSPFAPVRSPPSKACSSMSSANNNVPFVQSSQQQQSVCVMKGSGGSGPSAKENNINDANILGPLGEPDVQINELVLSVPSIATLTVPPMSASPPGSTLLLPKKQSMVMNHLSSFLSRDNSDHHQYRSNNRNCGSPPPSNTLSSASRSVPSTCQRRKKPSGYQQAGRDDSEEGEDSNEDGDNRYHKNPTHTPRSNPFVSSSSTNASTNYVSNTNNKFRDINMVAPQTPYGGGHHNNHHNDHHHQYYSTTPTGMSFPYGTPNSKGNYMLQNRYPFSPNPFSPHFSPIPQCQATRPPIKVLTPTAQRYNKSVSTASPCIPSFVATPKKQHMSQAKTPRGGHINHNWQDPDPARRSDESHNASWESNSVNSGSCNMSVSTCIINDGVGGGNSNTDNQNLSPTNNFSHNNKNYYNDFQKDSNKANHNNLDLKRNLSSTLAFTGSPIPEREHSQDVSKMEKSFDSSLASPTPSESTVNGSIMSYDMHQTRTVKANNNSTNQYTNVKVECIKTNMSFDDEDDKLQSKTRNEGISPTDVLSFPPPPTPFKERLTPRGSGSSHRYYPNTTSMPPNTPKRNRHPHLPSSIEEDDYDFLHTNMHVNNDGIDNDDQGISSLNKYTISPTSISTPTSAYQHRQQQHHTASRFATDFEEVGQLGTGSFGTVYKCMSRLDGCMYAIKTAKRKAKGNADRDRMLKEVYALAALCDQTDTGTFHIVRYHQAWMEEERLFIQTELCGSTLEEELKSGVLMRCIPRRFKLLREILLALELIHRNNMVHLDIKPENIFIKGDQYKLGDFGLVTKATTEDDVEEGDSRYMSLELLSGDNIDLTKSDIFSLGATLYEVCNGRPLPAEGDDWQKIRHNHLDFDIHQTISMSSEPATRALNSANTPSDLKDIIRLMMNRNPSIRPSAKELLQRRPLLSEEQKKLIAEQNKVKEAYQSLAKQRQILSKLTPPKYRKKLVRASTWDAGHIE